MRYELAAGLLAAAALLGTIACGGDDEADTSTNGAMTTTTSGGTSNGGSSATSSGSNGGAATTMAGPTTTTTGGNGGAYPTGPYGNDVGDTFPLVTLQGYVSTNPSALATTETWTPVYTSADLFASGADYALIHTALTG
ncbi:MAG: hypothetical protein AAF928_00245 [Myxococcota bacterium]